MADIPVRSISLGLSTLVDLSNLSEHDKNLKSRLNRIVKECKAIQEKLRVYAGGIDSELLVQLEKFMKEGGENNEKTLKEVIKTCGDELADLKPFLDSLYTFVKELETVIFETEEEISRLTVAKDKGGQFSRVTQRMKSLVSKLKGQARSKPLKEIVEIHLQNMHSLDKHLDTSHCKLKHLWENRPAELGDRDLPAKARRFWLSGFQQEREVDPRKFNRRYKKVCLIDEEHELPKRMKIFLTEVLVRNEKVALATFAEAAIKYKFPFRIPASWCVTLSTTAKSKVWTKRLDRFLRSHLQVDSNTSKLLSAFKQTLLELHPGGLPDDFLTDSQLRSKISQAKTRLRRDQNRARF